MTDSKLRFTYEDPSVLAKNTWNPNEMSPEAEAKLRNSLELNGHIRPILVRELEDGSLEIVGGAHRRDISIELGHKSVPVLNLGRISDEQAKKALLLDNSRYGEDEAGKLSALLSDIGEADDLVEWLNMDFEDLQTLMSADAELEADLDLLDELDDMGEDHAEADVPAREVQTHQTMKFKIPVEDAEFVADVLEGIMSAQKIADSDSLVRSGEALMWLARDYVQGNQEAAEESDFEDDFELPMIED